MTPLYYISTKQWKKEQVWPFFCCCTADSQTDTGRHQLYNNGSLVIFPHCLTQRNIFREDLRIKIGMPGECRLSGATPVLFLERRRGGVTKEKRGESAQNPSWHRTVCHFQYILLSPPAFIYHPSFLAGKGRFGIPTQRVFLCGHWHVPALPGGA